MIGADGANSRVAKEIGAGDYDYAIAFQVCSIAMPCIAPQGIDTASGFTTLLCAILPSIDPTR